MLTKYAFTFTHTKIFLEYQTDGRNMFHRIETGSLHPRPRERANTLLFGREVPRSWLLVYESDLD